MLLDRKLLAANFDQCSISGPVAEEHPPCNRGMNTLCCKTKVGAVYHGCCDTWSRVCSVGTAFQICCTGMAEYGPWVSSHICTHDGTVYLKGGQVVAPATKCNAAISQDVNFSGGDLKLSLAIQAVVVPSACRSAA